MGNQTTLGEIKDELEDKVEYDLMEIEEYQNYCQIYIDAEGVTAEVIDIEDSGEEVDEVIVYFSDHIEGKNDMVIDEAIAYVLDQVE